WERSFSTSYQRVRPCGDSPSSGNPCADLNNFLVSSIRRPRAWFSQDLDGAGASDWQELGLGPWNSNKHSFDFPRRILAGGQFRIANDECYRVSDVCCRDCLSYETVCESLLQKCLGPRSPNEKRDRNTPGQPLKSGISGVASMLKRSIARTAAVK